MSEQEILGKVLANTEEIKRNTAKIEKENQILITKNEEAEDKRKEQLREAQKNFKKISISVKNEVADKFEELAHKLNYPSTTAMMRTYVMLLLENEEYQKTFVEFAEVLKAETESGEA